ncbi:MULTISPECIES: hypothetical protein [Borreliella]|nr:hypothetical protein [Borreliella bavariensis]
MEFRFKKGKVFLYLHINSLFRVA